jgi:Ca2+-binding EF-hand superfamily protein
MTGRASSVPGTGRLTSRKGGGQPHTMKYTSWFQWFQSFFVSLYDIPEEELEEYRMLSGLDPLEICRLRAYFEDEVGFKGVMTQQHFMNIPFIAGNPLKERLALCFGYDNETQEMNFVEWIQGVALFNSHGKKEEKLKIAFKMQDFDGDGMISKDDLSKYMHLVTGLPEEVPVSDQPVVLKTQHLTMVQTDFNVMELKDIVDEIFRESSSDNKMQYITFQDFSRVMAPTDFHIKLALPF